MVNIPFHNEELPLPIGRSRLVSVRLRELVAALILALVTQPMMDSREATSGSNPNSHENLSTETYSPLPVVTPPVIRAIPDPDATQDRLNEPPPENNPYNPKREPLN